MLARNSAQATHRVATHTSDLERDARTIVNRIKEGVGKDYFAHTVGKHPNEDPLDLLVRAAALFMVDDVSDELDAEATKWAQARLSGIRRDDQEHDRGRA